MRGLLKKLFVSKEPGMHSKFSWWLELIESDLYQTIKVERRDSMLVAHSLGDRFRLVCVDQEVFVEWPEVINVMSRGMLLLGTDQRRRTNIYMPRSFTYWFAALVWVVVRKLRSVGFRIAQSLEASS